MLASIMHNLLVVLSGHLLMNDLLSFSMNLFMYIMVRCRALLCLILLGGRVILSKDM